MEQIIVLDFGGQYCHLIARRIRDIGVYASVMPGKKSAREIQAIAGVKGIILSGGAASVYDSSAPRCDSALLHSGIPILGICYGHQLIASLNGGKVHAGNAGEYGLTDLTIITDSALFNSLDSPTPVWMNHRDCVESLPEGFITTASTPQISIAAFECPEKKLYGVQFHPEVTHTSCGRHILENFVINICGAKKEWDATAVNVIEKEIVQTLAGKKAIIGLSGGIDSSVAALLVNKAIGSNLIAVYVDTGLMRAGETELMRSLFAQYNLNLIIVAGSRYFFDALKGIIEPERKRKIIGKLFIEVFDAIAVNVNASVLIQGTIYSDRIESGSTQHSSVIKSHHNVGGLPSNMKLQVYEPLRNLYKDEVRRIAAKLDIPSKITKRHVFPGPGFAVRIIGEVNPERASIVRHAQEIIEEEMNNAGLYDSVWMAFAILLPIKSVGIQGDERSYKYPIVVRIVESVDAMTANFAKIPYDVLEKISTRITNEVAGVNRVVYDISNKPPATMEWE